MNTSIEWIIFVTEQYDAMKLFYKDVLMFPVERDMPEEEFTQFKTDNCFVAIYGKLFVEKLLGKPVTGKPGSTIYSFKESIDIDTDYQQLMTNGVQFIKGPETQPWGQRTAYFTDPDGNIWEIQQWITR
jgi:uncharacterized glyoxalase superfamily protein PhnB